MLSVVIEWGICWRYSTLLRVTPLQVYIGIVIWLDCSIYTTYFLFPLAACHPDVVVFAKYTGPEQIYALFITLSIRTYPVYAITIALPNSIPNTAVGSCTSLI